jgi:hypothetical protein
MKYPHIVVSGQITISNEPLLDLSNVNCFQSWHFDLLVSDLS